MRARVFAAVFAWLAIGSLVPPVASQSTDPAIGTWTRSLAQSSYDPATLAPKNQTTRITAAGDMLTAITDGADAEGKKTHTEIAYKFDGKDYEYTGAPDADSTRVYTRRRPPLQLFDEGEGRDHHYIARRGHARREDTRTITTTGRDARGRVPEFPCLEPGWLARTRMLDFDFVVVRRQRSVSPLHTLVFTDR